MFNRTLDQPDQISRIDNAYTSLTMIQSDSLSDKFDQLDISVSLRLSFLAGIISIGGSARYLNDKRTSARSARISLQHSILTQYESLQTMDSRLLDYVDVRALDQLDVTHVVTGIQWGGKCIVSVSDSNEMSDEHRNIQAKLSMELNLVVAKITAEVGVNYTDNTFKNLSMYNFEVYGDILPDRVPENIVDALLFMNMTPTLLRNGNQGKGKQVSFTLTPVNVLRELWEREIKVSAFVHEIEESIVNKCVQLFDDMNAIQQQLNDYFTDFTNHWEPYVRDEAVTELQQLVANYTIYQTTNTKLLSALLIKIRAGNESVDQLIDILLKSRNDTYSREEMDNKLAKYDRLKNQLLLVDFVGNISTQANVCRLDKHTNLETIMLNNQDKNIYILFYNYEHSGNEFKQDNMNAIQAFRQLIENDNTIYSNLSTNVYCSINYEIINKMDVLHMAYISSTNNITKPKISLYRSDKLINDNILPIDLTNNPQIYVCGGYDGQQFYSQCYKLDILLNNWSKDSLLDHMIHSRYHLKLIQFDNKLYSIGGRQDISTNWVETYDTRNNLWAVVSPLNIKRYGLGAAVINNTIYVCGGLNTNELSIKSCEYFTRETNEWMFTNPMLTARDFHELVAHEGCLYAIGGNSNNNNQSVNTVEKYEHSSQTWEQVANMTSARSSFGAISFMGKIYVCGGRTSNTGQTVSNICEVYDSHTNKWTQISSMKESRFDLQLVTYNDKLYAVGGDKTNTIEIYDYMSDRWSHSITLPTKVGAFGVSIYKN